MSPGLQQIVPRLRRWLGIPGAPPSSSGGGLKPARERFQNYLTGSGIEIGALHNPMAVNADRATVRYVDRMSLDDQRRHYPELAGYPLVRPDILAEADALPMLADASHDFVIANHVLEHMPDPIGALKEWHRILGAGGILFLAIPDKRLTFDQDRPRTALAHLIADHADGGVGSRVAHCEEYSRLVHKKSGDEVERDVADLLARNYSIHFHVWIPDDIAELLGYMRHAIGQRWHMLESVESAGTDEFIYVLQKPR
ncbi:MAG: methyltransferase domain-containing protein [Luteitalea sp.]|nr:methyltransferase domain-containing protein [Luteitalea sp.]